MTAPKPTATQAAIQFALSSSRADDVIAGVKEAVRAELAQLDPSAKIQDTHYYNHSYVPDFVISWKDAGQTGQRDVFLRTSFASAVAAQDVDALGKKSPVLLALTKSENPEADEDVRRDAERAPNVLLTEVAALGEFTTQASDAEPLQALVRPNLVRGGRGLIAGGTLDALHVELSGGEGDIRKLEAFGALVKTVFVEAAATRLERAAQLLEMGLTGRTEALTPSDPDEQSTVIAGRLSDAELRVLLPYLLRREDVTQDRGYWKHLGSMLTLTRLEEMSSEFAGLDLTPLVSANLDQWLATRSFAAFRQDEVELGDSATEGVEATSSPVWRFFGSTLSVEAGVWRLHVTADSRRLRGREGSLAARWDDLSPRLSRYPVTAVNLNGVQRQVQVTADRAADVFEDVRIIRESIRDEFHVPSVTVRASASEDAAKVDVDFTRMHATATAPTAMYDLTRIAADVLTYRNPIPGDQLADVLGSDVSPPLPIDPVD